MELNGTCHKVFKVAKTHLGKLSSESFSRNCVWVSQEQEKKIQNPWCEQFQVGSICFLVSTSTNQRKHVTSSHYSSAEGDAYLCNVYEGELLSRRAQFSRKKTVCTSKLTGSVDLFTVMMFGKRSLILRWTSVRKTLTNKHISINYKFK